MPLAVDIHVLEQAVRIPVREFGVGEIGNLLTHALLDRRRRSA